jgi:lysine 6-dehydrogenase
MGSVISWDLARSPDVDSVLVADLDESRLAGVHRRAGKKVRMEKLDVTDPIALGRFFAQGLDVVVSALPHGSVHPADETAMRSGVKLVNIAFEDEQMGMQGIAKKYGSLLVPGAGLAPGLSAVLVAEGARRLDGAYEGHILVGGLPQKPEPPLNYRLIFSVKGLVREYLSARVVRGGRIENLVPFEIIEHHRFPKPVGVLEAFYTDGLGSALYTMRHFSLLDEKTLRWPGHGEKIKFLMDSGFFSEEPVDVGGRLVSPVDFSTAVLYKVLNRGGPKDLTVMRVDVIGSLDGKRARVRYEMIDRFDEMSKVTSMGRTTGFTAAIIARMVGRGELAGAGVKGPESFLDGQAVSRLLEELSEKGVVITRRRERFA